MSGAEHGLAKPPMRLLTNRHDSSQALRVLTDPMIQLSFAIDLSDNP